MEIQLLPAAEAEVYSYVNKEQCEELVRYRFARGADDPLSGRVEEMALRRLAGAGLPRRRAGRRPLRRPRPAAVPGGQSAAGLHPEHSDLPILCRLAGISFDR